MKKLRIIARLDVKNDHVIKGIHLEGLRKVGLPEELSCQYYDQGIDEILFMDAVASLYERNNLFHIIEKASEEVFVPITIGGGLRSLPDIEAALRSGADKVAINTQAIKTPGLIREAAHVYGSQCIVGSIEAKRRNNTWEAYIDNGREATGIDVLEWVTELEKLGAGEILLTSVDRDGTKKGLDTELADEVCKRVNIPVVLSGGVGKTRDLVKTCKTVPLDGVALASVLHYNKMTIEEAKSSLHKAGIEVRR